MVDSINKSANTWHKEFINPNLIQMERSIETLFEKKTKYQKASIHEGAVYGRSLILDGKTQSTELDEFIYHESLVHPTMIMHPNPKNILIAGGGEGATAREVLKHPTVNTVSMVDIDEEVVDACKKYLPKHHAGSFDDNRFHLIIDDILNFLSNNRILFDIAIIDLPDPLENGPAYKIFTREFYSLLKKSLSRTGIIVTQSGPSGPNSVQECFSAVQNTLKNNFKSHIAYNVYIPSYVSTWGFTIATDSDLSLSVSNTKVNALLAARKIKNLKMYDGESHQELFSLPLYVRKSFKLEKRIITYNNPIFME